MFSNAYFFNNIIFFQSDWLSLITVEGRLVYDEDRDYHNNPRPTRTPPTTPPPTTPPPTTRPPIVDDIIDYPNDYGWCRRRFGRPCIEKRSTLVQDRDSVYPHSPRTTKVPQTYIVYYPDDKFYLPLF